MIAAIMSEPMDTASSISTKGKALILQARRLHFLVPAATSVSVSSLCCRPPRVAVQVYFTFHLTMVIPVKSGAVAGEALG